MPVACLLNLVRFGPDTRGAMTYNSKTQTITVGPNSDFLSDSGTFFINVLRDLAKTPSAPQSIEKDWSVIEEWLGCAGRELNQQDIEKIGKAWRAYYAIGVAPSHALQKQFDDFSAKYKAEGKCFDADKAPTQVMDAFDRMLATDAQIKAKQSADWAAEKAKFSEIYNKFPIKPKTSWWRRQSRAFRAWVFLSVAWAAAALFYISVFDPFEIGDWKYADEKDYLKAFSISAGAFILGLVKRVYDRTVK